jgi:hypothetical protein
MRVNFFRAVTPSLALGLFLVTQALGRPQSHLSGGHKLEPKVSAKGDVADSPGAAGRHVMAQGAKVSSSMMSASENLVNQILHNEQLAIGRNDRLLGQEGQINQRLFQLYHTTPTTPAMARIIQAQIEHQLALFDQVERHLSLNKVHIGDNQGYDAQVARALGIMAQAAPGHPGIAAYIVAAMRLQMVLSNRLQDIAMLPPATPYMPSP